MATVFSIAPSVICVALCALRYNLLLKQNTCKKTRTSRLKLRERERLAEIRRVLLIITTARTKITKGNNIKKNVWEMPWHDGHQSSFLEPCYEHHWFAGHSRRFTRVLCSLWLVTSFLLSQILVIMSPIEHISHVHIHLHPPPNATSWGNWSNFRSNLRRVSFVLNFFFFF